MLKVHTETLILAIFLMNHVFKSPRLDCIMVSQRRNRILRVSQKRNPIIKVSQSRNRVSPRLNKLHTERGHVTQKPSTTPVARNYSIKVKKRVTWDKAIALREEELKELEDEGAEVLSLVTFIKKNEQLEQINNLPHLAAPKHAMRFQLQDGRVDVSEVLGRLGISQLQYEQEPGVWDTLEGLETGKSRGKFESGQVVAFRVVPDNSNSVTQADVEGGEEFHVKCRTTPSKAVVAVRPEGSLRNPTLRDKLSPWLDKWIVESDTVEDYYGRVSRLLEDRTDQGGGLCGIGIVLRLAFHSKHTRLLLSCRHIVDREDYTHLGSRGQLYAFGGPVKVLHISKKYDLALLQAPPLPGPTGFDLAAEGEEQPGREVRLLTFPWYLDTVWAGRPLEDVRPCQMPGHIASMGARRQGTGGGPVIVDALATYMGGLPGCSGGAVTLNSKVLCGVHSGVHPIKQLGMLPRTVLLSQNKPLLESTSDPVKEKKSKSIISPLKKCTSKRKLQLTGSSRFTQCASTHGYLAVYVSSSHIRETCLEWYTKPGIKNILNGRILRD